MKRYDDYSVEELRAELQRYFLYSDLDDEAVDEMERILAVLREKAPFHHPHTTEEMWAEFKAEHADELAALGVRKEKDTEEVMEKEPEANVVELREVSKSAAARSGRGRSFFRAALIAAAMVGVIIAATVTASAMGYNLWGWVPKWTDEDVRFESETSESAYMEYIPSMLKDLGITELLYPTWLPEDMVRTETIFDSDPLFLFESFHGDDRFLSITISPISGSETAVYQKEDNAPEEYIKNNITHYIFVNTNEITAVWYTECHTSLIVGSITLEEMKRVLDSVYEVYK